MSFYGFPGYLAKDTLLGFEKKFSIRTNYDELPSEDILYGRIRLSLMNCDLALFSDSLAGRMINERLLLPIEPQNIPNLGLLYPFFGKSPVDPANKYVVPWRWSIMVIAYNKKFVEESVDSWRILWNDRYRRRIAMPRDRGIALACALLLLGVSPDKTDERAIKKALNLLSIQKNLLFRDENESSLDLLASGDVWLAVGKNRDVLELKKDNLDIDFAIPREGSLIRADYLAIPRGSLHPRYAMEFMNYILDPEISAEIAADTDSASPVKAAEKYLRVLRKDLTSDQRIYPPQEIMKKLRFYKPFRKELLYK